ncbi:MAG TPA: hypothetical protein VJ721_07665 [Chthoniobacterales bacterium]|nr:hypothetical protein [Chthoniobacterales bacterium]
MKTSTRLGIVSASALLCGVGIFMASPKPTELEFDAFSASPSSELVTADGYQFAASRPPRLTFQELEAIIRRDPTAKQQRGKIEFGSVRLEEGTALAEVMFVSDEGRVLPFLYKLLPERNSWKIVNVQRIWYVPRSHLLRGVRA